PPPPPPHDRTYGRVSLEAGGDAQH
ncbi:MAG: hypothetical protein QOJ98_3101, partial [Acidobacteriota bacterium]|nr:hypothetical protein [Acidobacteriota bacterium]